MAVIVRHKASHIELVLLGPGYGAYMAMAATQYTSSEESGEFFKVATCDRSGKVLWFDANDVTVVEVDGMVPSAILDDRKQRAAAPQA